MGKERFKGRRGSWQKNRGRKIKADKQEAIEKTEVLALRKVGSRKDKAAALPLSASSFLSCS